MGKCCLFFQSIKNITWNKTTLTICMLPFVLLLGLTVALVIISANIPGIVVTNSLRCADVGKKVLDEGGSAVDASIAAMICEGVAAPNSAGLGGGFVATMYMGGKFDTIVATPTIPRALTNLNNLEVNSTTGAMYAGVPGELKGYWEMHQKYGLLSWKRLFRDSIELCESGVNVTSWLSDVLETVMPYLNHSPTIKKVLSIYQSEKGKPRILKCPVLAKTLKLVSEKGIEIFYNGELGKDFIADLKQDGGVMTEQDLREYKVIWETEHPKARLSHNIEIHSTPLPTSGILTVFVLNVIRKFDFAKNPGIFWHKAVETMKHAYGLATHLGDRRNDLDLKNNITEVYDKMMSTEFIKFIRGNIRDNETYSDPSHYGAAKPADLQEGSANICVSSPQGDAVAATTSLLTPFGAYFASVRTGIITSNVIAAYMDPVNGKLTTTPANRFLPGKHLFTPFSPTIVLEHSKARIFYVVAASGGKKAALLTMNALIKYVLMRKNAFESVNPSFIWHKLFPNVVEYESPIDDDILQYLRNVGHKVIHRITTHDNYSKLACIGYKMLMPDGQFNTLVGGNSALVDPKHELSMILALIVAILAICVVAIMLFEVLHPKQGRHSSVALRL